MSDTEPSSNQFPHFQIYEIDGKFKIESLAGSYDTRELADEFLTEYAAAQDIDVDHRNDNYPNLSHKLRLVAGGYFSIYRGYYLKQGSTYYSANFGDTLEICLKEHKNFPYLGKLYDFPTLSQHPEEPPADH